MPANASSATLAARIAAAATAGPLVITDALGAGRFDAELYTRRAFRHRCSVAGGAPPPSPPWPTLAYREPTAVGAKWAGMHFDNGPAVGVFDLPSLLDAQDSGRLRGVALFDSPANHTCAPALLRHGKYDDASAAAAQLPALRFFPRDFEVALGGPHGEGLWRKGGTAWDDPDLFASMAGTRTHVHIDSHCTRFSMLQLAGRKLWRLMPPEEGVHLAPTAANGGEHFSADVLDPSAESNADVQARLDAVEVVYEFTLAPGELALIPQRWAHAVHNLDDTVALTYNFVDETNLGCYLSSLRLKVGALLQKLVAQLAQGRGARDAAAAFSRHAALAYFAHLLPISRAVDASGPRVTVDDEHTSWEAFFARQGPYASGGVAAIHAVSERLATSILAFVEALPSLEAAAAAEPATLVGWLESELPARLPAKSSGLSNRDEL